MEKKYLKYLTSVHASHDGVKWEPMLFVCFIAGGSEEECNQGIYLCRKTWDSESVRYNFVRLGDEIHSSFD